jgi:hypothetical protein
MQKKIERRLTAIWLELVTGFLWWIVGGIPSHYFRRFFYRFWHENWCGSTIHMMARIYDPRHSNGEDSIIGEMTTLDGRRQIEGSRGHHHW